ARLRKIPPGQLLDAADAITQRVAVTVERPRGLLPVAIVFDEHVERAQQLIPILSLALLDRAEHAATVGDQRVVVLQREQQLEGAAVPIGGDLGRVSSSRSVPILQAHGLERAARLMEAESQRMCSGRAARGSPDLAE